MKMQIATLSLSVSLALSVSSSLAAASPVESLRGDTAIEADSVRPVRHKVEVVQGGFDRSYKEQPPLIPHGIEKYSIDLRQNGCLKCHSTAAAEKENAKPTPESHFLDREGKKLDHLSTRRYFCTQCHAAQIDGTPLVENTFQGRK